MGDYRKSMEGMLLDTCTTVLHIMSTVVVSVYGMLFTLQENSTLLYFHTVFYFHTSQKSQPLILTTR